MKRFPMPTALLEECLAYEGTIELTEDGYIVLMGGPLPPELVKRLEQVLLRELLDRMTGAPGLPPDPSKMN